MASVAEQDVEERPAFGAWLAKQKDRRGLVGQFATAVAGMRGYPREGNPEEVRKWLQNQRPSGDDWEALDDAELDWSAL